jgi:hypothetical protein
MGQEPKRRRKKDPNAPKNPVSAYLFFVANQRAQHTGSYEGVSTTRQNAVRGVGLKGVEIVR